MELPVSIKTPRLIRDRCGVYYFRLIVPLALRDTIGKAELRRSLRTKEADIARHRALILSAQMEAVMIDLKFLTNPSIADFPHLLKPGAKRDIREKIRIDMERGIIETDPRGSRKGNANRGQLLGGEKSCSTSRYCQGDAIIQVRHRS